jgi:hypothetical protein
MAGMDFLLGSSGSTTKEFTDMGKVRSAFDQGRSAINENVMLALQQIMGRSAQFGGFQPGNVAQAGAAGTASILQRLWQGSMSAGDPTIVEKPGSVGFLPRLALGIATGGGSLLAEAALGLGSGKDPMHPGGRN